MQELTPHLEPPLELEYPCDPYQGLTVPIRRLYLL